VGHLFVAYVSQPYQHRTQTGLTAGLPLRLQRTLQLLRSDDLLSNQKIAKPLRHIPVYPGLENLTTKKYSSMLPHSAGGPTCVRRNRVEFRDSVDRDRNCQFTNSPMTAPKCMPLRQKNVTLPPQITAIPLDAQAQSRPQTPMAPLHHARPH